MTHRSAAIGDLVYPLREIARASALAFENVVACHVVKGTPLSALNAPRGREGHRVLSRLRNHRGGVMECVKNSMK